MLERLYALDDRRLLSATGEDVFLFLQNIVTADLRRAQAGEMVYSCLLGPQGRLLHAFFILPRAGGGFLLDCDAAGREDLLRRLDMYRLRARVALARDESLHVYAAAAGSEGFPDPRLPALGRRIYAPDVSGACDAPAAYDALCIRHGVPPQGAMQADRDFMTDLNLDLLGAASFDKGCFVGQELAARMHHRGLAKKRLLIVEGGGLAAGDAVRRGGTVIGDIRITDPATACALAVLRLDVMEESADRPFIEGKSPITVRTPAYFLKKN